MVTGDELHPETLAVAAGRPERQPGAPLNVPLSVSSTYVAGGEHTYAREGNDTWAAFEDALGALEGGTAVAFASGLAALAALVEQVPVGGTVVVPGASYTGTRFLLQRLAAQGRVEVRLVDVADTDATLTACDGAALAVLESPTNPLLAVADIPAIAAGARARNTMLVIDSTFATPFLQRPLDLGADAVLHSATKFLAGHSDVVMGAVVTRDEQLAGRVRDTRTLTGAIPGPFEAFLALRGLRTLGVRMERAQRNAADLAERLAGHPLVSRVRYPGFGAIVSFELDGAAATAEAVCEAVRLVTHATSLGGVETTMERRRRHPGEDLTPDDLIRMSVGIEHVDDLWADLRQAFDSAGGSG